MLSPTQLTVIGLAGIPADTTITAITAAAVPDIAAARCVKRWNILFETSKLIDHTAHSCEFS
jgi:hypothetical protein